MGEALITAVLRSGVPAGDVVVGEPALPRAADLAARHGVRIAPGTAEAVSGAGVVVVAVKPQGVADLLAQMSPALAAGTLVVTVAAGLPTGFYEARLPPGTPVVRVMPNTPAVIGQGAGAICAGAAASGEHLDRVSELLAATGLVLRVPESLMDAVTAVSGSGPAYVFYMVEALAEAGALLGLPHNQALELAVATFRGAAAMLTGEQPSVLRERVSSPGGTTVAAIRELDAREVRAAIIAAAEAARDRARELAAESG